MLIIVENNLHLYCDKTYLQKSILQSICSFMFASVITIMHLNYSISILLNVDQNVFIQFPVNASGIFEIKQI